MKVRTERRGGEGGSSDGPASDRRAQLVLVAGFALAVTFVILALLLNSAIFAENIATRQTGGESAATERTISTVDSSVGVILTQVNTNNTNNLTYSALTTNFTEAVAIWTDSANRQLAVGGQKIKVDVSGTTEGTRMVHTNTSRNWTSKDGDVGWTLFRDVDADNVRWFELNVSRKSLNESTLDTSMAATLNSSFNIVIEDDSANEWRVYIFEGAGTGNIYILVEEPGEDFRGNPGAYVDFATEACLVNDEHVEIDLWESRIAGIHCNELSFVQNLTGPITVRYENTTTDPGLLLDPVARVKGEYDVLVETKDIVWGNFHAASQDKSPFTLTALTGATITRTYARENVDFTGTATVEPATIGGLGVRNVPVVHFDVNDSSNLTHDRFKVNWQVRDANGDLKQVNVTIVDGDGDTVYDETYSVKGTQAEGTDTMIRGDDTDPYTITVKVVDHQDHAATQKQKHDADGNNDEVTLL